MLLGPEERLGVGQHFVQQLGRIDQGAEPFQSLAFGSPAGQELLPGLDGHSRLCLPTRPKARSRANRAAGTAGPYRRALKAVLHIGRVVEVIVVFFGPVERQRVEGPDRLVDHVRIDRGILEHLHELVPAPEQAELQPPRVFREIQRLPVLLREHQLPSRFGQGDVGPGRPAADGTSHVERETEELRRAEPGFAHGRMLTFSYSKSQATI